MRRQRGGALLAARPAAGENMSPVRAPDRASSARRQAGGRQAGRLIGVDIVGKARMAGAGPQRDMRLAVADQDNAHR